MNLKPIKVNSYETGLKSRITDIFTFDISLYYMEKKDDIVSYSPSTGVTERLNAGETAHKGIELGLGIKPLKEIELNTSYSYATHKYKTYSISSTVDYSGKEIPQAPRQIINTRLVYKPALLKGGIAELEWVRLGKYWLDDANTEKYSGHDLFKIRASYHISKGWEIYSRVINITEKLYTERESKSGADSALYAPGSPRTFFAGITYNWGRK